MTLDLMVTRCSAKSKQSGERCKNRPVPGAAVCRIHGGAARQVRAKATERIVEKEACNLLARLGDPVPIGHPVEELVKVASEVRAWQALLREMVCDLRDLASTDKAGGEHERAVVALYERSLDRTSRILVDIVRLDLDARLVRLEEDRGEMVASLIQQVLRDIGLDHQQRTAAQQLIATGLRAMSA